MCVWLPIIDINIIIIIKDKPTPKPRLLSGTEHQVRLAWTLNIVVGCPLPDAKESYFHHSSAEFQEIVRESDLYEPSPSAESLTAIAQAMGAAEFEHYTEGRPLVKRLIPADSEPDLDVVEHQGNLYYIYSMYKVKKIVFIH